MKSEFILAVKQLCAERNLPQEVILEAIEASLVSAYRRNFGDTADITARVDSETGDARVFARKTVVENVEDPILEISPDQARKIDPKADIGSVVETETTPRDFGRIAAQTAKQVILQRIREAERDVLYSAYIDREGELITGTVQSVDSQAVTINLGRVEAFLPRSEQIPHERYSIGQRLRVYVAEVQRTPRGPQIIVSRAHQGLLRRLLEVEVPEIFNGAVEIKRTAREAGARSKVAVAAIQPGVDPVGACVGMRGVRIQSIVNQLSGEKIDIVEWSPNTEQFIANALSPARVLIVRLDEETAHNSKTAVVVVPDDQLSLAIGKEGQNARLAAKLTGWRIDIKSASQHAEEAARTARRRAQRQAEQAVAAVVPALERVGASLIANPVLELAAEPEVLESLVAHVRLQPAVAELRAEEKARRQTIEAAAAKLAARSEALTLRGARLVEKAAARVQTEPEVLQAAAGHDLLKEAQHEQQEAQAAAEAMAEVPPAVEALEAADELDQLEPTPEIGAERLEETIATPGAGEDGDEEDEDLITVEEWEEEEFEYEDQGEDEGVDFKGKKKVKKKVKTTRKTRTLVYDPKLGQVVAKKHRKPSRRQGWDDFEDY